jgi:alcohol dehydrogenase (NADP+)
MKLYTLPSGAKMPALGLGTWKADPGVVGYSVKTAIQLGYRHIDCAAVYENEKEVGAALKECLDEGIVKREDLFITSKLWCSNYEPKNVKPALEKQLEDLQVGYLDLYLMHWMVAKTQDGKFLSLEELPPSKTFAAMKECMDAGLVKNIGVSNCTIKKMKDIIVQTGLTPAVNQIERHPYLQQPKMMEFCKEHNILITAYAPLGSGDRPAGLKKDDEPVLLKDETVAQIAQKHGVSPAQVLLAWVTMDGSAAAKSTNAERLAQNLKAAELKLDEDDLEKIQGLDRHRRYLDGAFWVKEGSPYTMENIWDGE